jgi:hypothetical protein
MARAQNLMGVGFSPVQALQMGGATILSPLAGATTAQATAASMGTADVVLGTTSAGQTAFLCPDMNVGESILFVNTSSTTALLFPVTGAQINGAGANNSINVAQNKPTLIFRTSATAFYALIGA